MNNARGWWVVLTVAMVALIAHFYGHVLVAPGNVLLTGSGDGIKNYYTFIWHVDRDGSVMHYSGSGHPYGEQVFYTDGHPLLSWVIQAIPFLAPHAIAILNVSLILGIVLCAWTLFAVLRTLQVAPWAAAIGAFGISVLQPQLFRLGGHLSLGHAWMIPMVMLVLLRTRQSRNWLRWTGVGSLVVLTCFLTHPYLGLMGVLLVLGYHVGVVLFGDRTTRTQKRTLAAPLLIAIAPMILFMVLLSIGDSTMDRPTAPKGLDEYATRLMSLMVPTHDPLATPLKEFFKYEALDWETWCYIGLATMLVSIVAAAKQLGHWAIQEPAKPMDAPGTLFLAGFLVLLFAMGLWQDWFGTWLPLLAQFRGAGRFAWVFYFAATIFATVRLYEWLFLREEVRYAVAVPIYVLVIGSLAVEGWAMHADVGASIGHAPNVFNPSLLSEEQRTIIEQAKNAHAAAIIPLPYIHIGSERYQKDAPEGSIAGIFPIAYHAELPIMAGVTSRTSLQRTRDLLALRAPSYYTKPLAKATRTADTYIMAWTGEVLEPDEDSLWQQGRPLVEKGALKLRTIDHATLFKNDSKDRLSEYPLATENPLVIDGWTLRNRFLGTSAITQVRTAADSISGMVKDYTTIIRTGPGELDTTLTYEFSCAYRSLSAEAINCLLIMEDARSDGTDARWSILRNVRSMPVQSNDGWTICTMRFKPNSESRSYKFLLKGPDKKEHAFSVHDAILRPTTIDAWRKGSWEGAEVYFLNNIPLSAPRSPE